MSSKICEKHFDISDIYNTKKKKRLNPDAVPKHIIAPDRIEEAFELDISIILILLSIIEV
ncbi:hypothetical protein ALC57_05128 [Trachymyrmex cornetzi]|uniref:THAP-type domain-containing protein n=1 Tax=Trachymyrmex cornetzi TaxID=471704 RepID=A0A151JBI3_9HYME|nr:hypothetical protein ALC57_05128 [Trachymyrmex cornetzi]